MKTIAAAACLALFACPVLAADRIDAEGATSAYYLLRPHVGSVHDASGVDLVVAPVGTGRAVLDLIEGRAGVAVVTAPLSDAVEAARTTAYEEGRALPATGSLVYTPLPAVDATGRMLAFVTRGAPSPELLRVVDHFRKDSSLRQAALLR